MRSLRSEKEIVCGVSTSKVLVPSSVRTPLAVCTNMSSTVAGGAAGIGPPSYVSRCRLAASGSLSGSCSSCSKPGSERFTPFGPNSGPSRGGSAQADQGADGQIGAQDQGGIGHELPGVAQQPVLSA